MTITEIKARTLIQVFEPIKTRGALETVRRLSQCINEIMIYVINTGLLEVRPSNAAGTKWIEIDLENKLWYISAERMKAKKVHTVPLSNEALGLLAQLKPLSGGSEYVFPS